MTDRKTTEDFIVTLPISSASADCAGAPAVVIERIIKTVGRPTGRHSMLAASPAAPGAEVEPVAWCAFAENGNVRLWEAEHARQVRASGYFLDMRPLYPSPPTTDAIKAQARREALEEVLAAMDEHIAGEVELRQAARRAGDHSDVAMHGMCGGAMLEMRAVVAALAGKGEAK